jgi:Domain of unknown function (DUF4367)
MHLSTLKIAVIIIIVLSAISGILIYYNSPESLPTPRSEPIMTPLYLGSLAVAKMVAGDDLRVPAYLPPGYNYSQGSLFTGNQEKTQLTFQKGTDVIHVFQGKVIEPPPYFVQTGNPEPVSINGNTGTWIPGISLLERPEKPFNQIEWCEGNYSYWIQSSLSKDEMIKIAGSLTPISDELIQRIAATDERGT